MEKIEVPTEGCGDCMNIKKTYIIEDTNIVVDIMYDGLQVLTLEELKKQIKDFVKDARNTIGDLIGEVNFKCVDLDRQIFFVPYTKEKDSKMFAIVVQIEGEMINKEVVLEWLKKNGFTEAE